MNNSYVYFCVLIFLSTMAVADIKKLPRSGSAKSAQVYIISPKNGDTVKSPVSVVFGLKGMGVAPAGIEKNHTGHHHLLIDVESFKDFDKPIPADDHHKHFGGGQTETIVELKPGKHSLQLLLADHLHIPHNPPLLSEKITITVE